MCVDCSCRVQGCMQALPCVRMSVLVYNNRGVQVRQTAQCTGALRTAATAIPIAPSIAL